MNTPVNFELAKLLKEKEFDENCRYCYVGKYEPHHVKVTELGYLQRNSELINLVYTAPTIGEVVMWLYEKYGIWIYSVKSKYGWLGCVKDYSNEDLKTIYTTHSEHMFLADKSDKWYNSPTEAYEAAIEYTLNNLI